MTLTRPTRRATLLGLTAMAAASALPLRAQAPVGTVAVLKDPGCGCCEAWADTLRAEGFVVTVEEADNDAMERARIVGSVPGDLYGCHTGRMGELVIEGHVPAADILRLSAEAPDAAGLAVAGMPMGSPGMETDGMRDAFDVVLWRRDGTTEVFASYPAA
ncbi:DUF411 domain-containing protein [Rubellimicrobium aerolatum]|uniref:DUF411 domain-containing protein n=1 Tax=Rubellimicrobium aerolatum TaxID=490979 RepID=A0ABW0SH05_9RHOB|nr:DUF411 domain-containing protein [Rubellimicrobium aerolatum]MBP1807629.1 hypothetical protein [Rubellimicrobium aerolatum]